MLKVKPSGFNAQLNSAYNVISQGVQFTVEESHDIRECKPKHNQFIEPVPPAPAIEPYLVTLEHGTGLCT